MAITVTDRGTNQTTAGGSITLQIVGTNFSPAAGSILVVGLAVNALNGTSTGDMAQSAMSDNIADTGGGSWTSQALCTRGSVPSTGYLERVQIFTRVIGTAPGATKHVQWDGQNAFGTNASTDGWCAIHCWEVSGQHATPIGLTASPSPVTSGTTFNTDLGGTPTSTSAVFGVIEDDASNGGATQPSGWTESDEQIPAWGATFEWAFKNGSAVQSPQWSALHSGSRLLGCAVEVKAAAGAASTGAPFPAHRIQPILMRK